MAEYIYIDDFAKKGKIGIFSRVFDRVVTNTIENIPGVSVSSQMMKRNQKFRLNRPVQTYIVRGIAHIYVTIDIKKSDDIHKITKVIQEEVSSSLLQVTEQIPFDVQVKVASILK